MGLKKQVLCPKNTPLGVRMMQRTGPHASAAYQIVSFLLYLLDGCDTLLAWSLFPCH